MWQALIFQKLIGLKNNSFSDKCPCQEREAALEKKRKAFFIEL